MENKKLDSLGTYQENDQRQKKYYSSLFSKLIGLTLICSLVPLLLVGWLINIHYSRFAREKMIYHIRTQVEYHSRIIELFINERSSKLILIAKTHSLDYLGRQPNLSNLYKIMNEGQRSITDLGVIDEKGRHVAYAGPYDLMDKNYIDAQWFKEVMKQGLYVSDMFLGFRKEPHFIIAVKRVENDCTWILRATIDSEVFRSLVEDVRIGKTGEVFLLNREGVFQTSPRFSGNIMDKSSFRMEVPHEGTDIIVGNYEMDIQEGPAGFIIARTWLNVPRWMLVVKQKKSEALSEVRHTNYATLIFLHISALVILAVSVLITGYMIRIIQKRDRQTDQLNEQLFQASKMAAVGELSAGVAHEINNPLEIILTEKQILTDCLERSIEMDGEFREQLIRSLSQIEVQINRCKRITVNLLRFSRRTGSIIERVNVNQLLKEITELMEKEASTSGIEIIMDFEHLIPPFLSDPSQLQQVFLNLMNNALDALEAKPYGRIFIKTILSDDKKGVEVIMADTGSGISDENIEKIFDPFFTTKPVGKGTGLGLSISYSIIKRLGGEIFVTGEYGKGSEFHVYLPFELPAGVSKKMETR